MRSYGEGFWRTRTREQLERALRSVMESPKRKKMADEHFEVKCWLGFLVGLPDAILTAGEQASCDAVPFIQAAIGQAEVQLSSFLDEAYDAAFLDTAGKHLGTDAWLAQGNEMERSA